MNIEVHLYGDPILREKGKTITEFSNDVIDFAKSIQKYVAENDNAAGLAAQQAGRALRLFVVDVNDDYPCEYLYDGEKVPLSDFMPLIVINPEIVETSEEDVVYTESCLSIPGIPMPVERPEGITMKFQDLEGNPHTIECDGAFARVMQHEYDHTEGVLFIDRVNPRDRKLNESKLKQLRRYTRDKMKHKKKKIK